MAWALPRRGLFKYRSQHGFLARTGERAWTDDSSATCQVPANFAWRDIQEWPEIRAEQKGKPQLQNTREVSPSVYPRMTKKQNYEALPDAIEKKPGLSGFLWWHLDEDIPWAWQEVAKDPIDVSTWFEEVSRRLLGHTSCTEADLATPVGPASSQIEVIVDSAPRHSYGDDAYPPGGLRESGFSETTSFTWTFNLQKYKLVPRAFEVSRSGRWTWTPCLSTHEDLPKTIDCEFVTFAEETP